MNRLSEYGEKLETIAHETGNADSIDNMIVDAIIGGLCPGMCKFCENVMDDVDVDATDNWCSNCEQNGVESCVVIAGVDV